MVNNRTSQPVHDLERIKELVAQDDFELVNLRARKNFKSLAWTTAHMKALIGALCVPRHFKKTVAGCCSEIGTVNADCYCIFFDEENLTESKDSGIEFFIKLAIDANASSTVIVSFHLSGQP